MRLWLGASAAGLALSAIVGAFIGLSMYTFAYAEGLSYLSNDPRACVNCHIMRDQYDAWQKASHHAHAACNDCHVPHDVVGKLFVKTEHGLRHSYGFTFDSFHEPIRIKPSSRAVVLHNCVRCHEGLVSGIAHAGGSDEVADCIRCHTSVGHGPTR